MGTFIAGLFSMIIGFLITLIAVGLDQSVTFDTAGFWHWLPTIVGVIFGLIIWFGDALAFADVDLFD